MEAILSGGRVGLVAIGVLGLLAAAPVAGRADCDETVRVLLTRSPRPVVVSADGRRHEIARRGDGVSVDGRPAGPRWRTPPLSAGVVGDLRVAGRLVAVAHGEDVAIVNEVPLDRYVAGAIGGEMPSGWADAALRAQAVASRTYALHQRAAAGGRPWDVEAGTRSQVYRGLDVAAPARRAAEATRCQVLVHGGAPILAAFHSASGGRTASAAEVWGRHLAYLVSRDVPGEDDSPDTFWRAAIPAPTLERALRAAGHPIGRVEQASIEARSDSGRVRWIRFQGERGQVRLSGRRLRSALGESILRSTLFELRADGDDFVFVGSGSGHGVGMSQWGARSLAEGGATYREILETFYPGTTLRTWNEARTASWRPAAD